MQSDVLASLGGSGCILVKIPVKNVKDSSKAVKPIPFHSVFGQISLNVLNLHYSFINKHLINK